MNSFLVMHKHLKKQKRFKNLKTEAAAFEPAIAEIARSWQNSRPRVCHHSDISDQKNIGSLGSK